MVPQNTCKQTKHLEQKKNQHKKAFFWTFYASNIWKGFFGLQSSKTHLGRGTQLLFFFFKALSFTFSILGSLFIFSYIIIIYCFFSLEKVPSSCTYLKLFFVNVGFCYDHKTLMLFTTKQWFHTDWHIDLGNHLYCCPFEVTEVYYIWLNNEKY